MKVIVGTWKVKPESIEEFINLSKEAVIVSSAEAGNISFNFTQYKTLDDTFLFFEEWKDQAAIDYHIAQDYFKTFMEKTAKLIAAKPIMKIYDVTNIEEL